MEAEDSSQEEPSTAWAAVAQHFAEASSQFRARAATIRVADMDRGEADALEALASEIDRLRFNTDAQSALEFDKAHREDWLKQRQHTRDWQIENTRQVIQIALTAIRTVVLVNGGAMVALLAFLGNVWSKGGHVAPFNSALTCYAAGLVLAVLSLASAYGTQYFYGDTSSNGGPAAASLKWGKALHVGTVVVFLLAVGAFVGGCYSAFRSLKESEPPASASLIEERTHGRQEAARSQTTAPAVEGADPKTGTTGAEAGAVQRRQATNKADAAAADSAPRPSGVTKSAGQEVTPSDN